jgi:hypothetical protein
MWLGNAGTIAERVGEEIKINCLFPLILTFSAKGERTQPFNLMSIALWVFFEFLEISLKNIFHKELFADHLSHIMERPQWSFNQPPFPLFIG